MGLLNNNFRDSFGTYRFFGATLSNGSSPYSGSFSNKLPGGSRNIFATDAGVDPLSAKPAGARHPVAWQMPQKAGGLASRNNTSIDLIPTGSAVRGLPGSGSTTITFTPTATGGLIVSGTGSATIELSATGSILSIAAGSGSATIELSGSALIGALAGMAGTGNVTLSPTALISAIGYLSGLSTSETEFSANALAQAVWDAVAADYNTAGSMGAKMNAAGGSNSPEDIADAVWTAANMDTAAINKIADILLRRATSSVEASSNGETLDLRSLYGMIAQGVHKTSIAGSTLTITKSDDSTTLGTRTITTDSSAEPITGLDTD